MSPRSLSGGPQWLEYIPEPARYAWRMVGTFKFSASGVGRCRGAASAYLLWGGPNHWTTAALFAGLGHGEAKVREWLFCCAEQLEAWWAQPANQQIKRRKTKALRPPALLRAHQMIRKETFYYKHSLLNVKKKPGGSSSPKWGDNPSVVKMNTLYI